MKKKLLLFIVLTMIMSLGSIAYGIIDESSEEVESLSARGKVLEVLSESDMPVPGESDSFTFGTQLVKIKVLNGKYKGEEFLIENSISGNMAFDIKVKAGDQVLLVIEEEQGVPQVYITDFVRDRYLLILLLIFLSLLVIIGKIKGVKSVITLSITGLTIIKIMLPLILMGYSPILVAILAAVIITILTFIIIGGLNIKSISAIVGTIGGVMCAGFLAYIVGSAVKLTGLSSEEASMLMYIPQNIGFDYRGLLFAGIIIGTLGAVMDIGMSIASAMYELKSVSPEISPIDLIKSGLNIGRDVMGTMSNTLILAYTGSSIPLLLLFMAYDTSFSKILNLDLIATEIVRALVGSIGLIIAIPITALSTGLIIRYMNGKVK